MSFMAVAYVPSIIEDLYVFRKERANGLYGPLPFTIANALIGLPWLFIIALMFSIMTYWLGNFQATARGFWMWVLWLYLDLLAAEGLVVLVSSIFPIFVVSLVITAFANGLWMCVGGFLVPMTTLNVFWKYVFHYIDYQTYVFQGMMVNQFKSTIWGCAKLASGFQCMYPSDLQFQGQNSRHRRSRCLQLPVFGPKDWGVDWDYDLNHHCLPYFGLWDFGAEEALID